MRKKEITKEMPQTAIEITSTFFSIGEFVDIRFIYFHSGFSVSLASFYFEETADFVFVERKSCQHYFTSEIIFPFDFLQTKKKKKKKRSLKRILFIKIDVSF